MRGEHARAPGDGARAPVVLIAEDDAALRALLAEELRAEGCDVVEAKNGRELFWFVETQSLGPIDLILSDLLMPVYNGLDVAEAWASMGPGPPIILMSAFPDAVVRQRALALGVPLLDKPFAIDRLLELVHQLLAPRMGAVR